MFSKCKDEVYIDNFELCLKNIYKYCITHNLSVAFDFKNIKVVELEHIINNYFMIYIEMKL